MRRLVVLALCVMAVTGAVSVVRGAKPTVPETYTLRIRAFDPQLQSGKNAQGQTLDHALQFEVDKPFHVLSGGELLPRSERDPFQFGTLIDGYTVTDGDTVWIDLKLAMTGRFSDDRQKDIQIIDGDTLRFRCPMKLGQTRKILRAAGRYLEVTVSPSNQ